MSNCKLFDCGNLLLIITINNYQNLEYFLFRWHFTFENPNRQRCCPLLWFFLCFRVCFCPVVVPCEFSSLGRSTHSPLLCIVVQFDVSRFAVVVWCSTRHPRMLLLLARWNYTNTHKIHLTTPSQVSEAASIRHSSTPSRKHHLGRMRVLYPNCGLVSTTSVMSSLATISIRLPAHIHRSGIYSS